MLNIYIPPFQNIPDVTDKIRYSKKGMDYWRQTCNDEGYRAYQERTCLPAAADKIGGMLNGSIAVVALGCGTATQETRLLNLLPELARVHAHDLEQSAAENAAQVMAADGIAAQPVWGTFNSFSLPKPVQLAILLGNTIGNRGAEEVLRLLSWINTLMSKDGLLLVEWAPPFDGDTRALDTENGSRDAIEEAWHHWVATKALGPEATISTCCTKYSDGGYEQTCLGQTVDGRQVVVWRFVRYTIKAMLELCNEAGFTPVANGMWRNDPSCLLLLKKK